MRGKGFVVVTFKEVGRVLYRSGYDAAMGLFDQHVHKNVMYCDSLTIMKDLTEVTFRLISISKPMEYKDALEVKLGAMLIADKKLVMCEIVKFVEVDKHLSRHGITIIEEKHLSKIEKKGYEVKYV